MPKVNVYLPDELADAVKAANLPLSAICQRALEQSVKRVTAIRATVLGDLAIDPTAQLSHFTDRSRTVLKMAIAKAQEDGADNVGTEHLLHAMLAEGDNLALRVLRAEEIEPAVIAVPLPTGSGSATQFSSPAANALELTVTEAISLGHNYVGCEHLLLGLLSEPDGTAGHVLRQLGLDLRSTRKAVAAALLGYAHLRAQPANNPATVIAAVVRQELQPIIERIERLEQG
nr:Clp protease N-terminal domain-containing protein [Kibdelosporangium sp. MJ126-NF4]CEL22641.1 ATP-dependent Clp protease, ATP-binding subunit ClpC / Negative regulator of genetic competence clcC/mecB [Kibdelosporangium sp. MJ126-NF4]CTQ89782.1 ATP-dependent Clp protease, ATP-binding subunit ClpC / Negative regulator of genetic competence clcC/mecB [Kibdelosporangium sp. MJ126-NF4]